MKKRIYCNFPPNLIKEPILSQSLPSKYNVRANIRGAQISDEIAIVLVDIEGETTDVGNAVNFLREKGVEVREVDPDKPVTRPPQAGDA